MTDPYEDGKSLRLYLREAGSFATLTPEEEKRLFRAVRRGGRAGAAARNRIVEANLRRDALSAVLDTLDARERSVIGYRYGLDDGCDRTLEEIGRFLHITRERVRQIEAKAICKLRQPDRLSGLRECLASA